MITINCDYCNIELFNTDAVKITEVIEQAEEKGHNTLINGKTVLYFCDSKCKDNHNS